MRIKIDKSRRYADIAPHLPQINFIAGEEVNVSDALGQRIVRNGDGHEVVEIIEAPVVEVESKDEGVQVESKDETPEPEPDPDANADPEPEPEPDAEEEPKKKRGRPPGSKNKVKDEDSASTD